MMIFLIGMQIKLTLIGQAITPVAQPLSDMSGSLVDTIWYN